MPHLHAVRWFDGMFFLLLAAGCRPDPAGTDTGSVEAVVCAEPVEGMARFTEASAAVGLTRVLPDFREVIQDDGQRVGQGIAVADLDVDGDLDIVVGRFSEPPDVYFNDGTGHFALQAGALSVLYAGEVMANEEDQGASLALSWAAADLDGDRAPEVIGSGFGFLALYPNQGDGTFGTPITLHAEEQVLGLYLSFTLGDPDADGDLDILMASNVGIDTACGSCEPVLLWPEMALENRGGLSFAPAVPFYVDREGGGSHTMLAVFTDRDGDGDQDIFVPKDYWGDNAFWRNDGGGEWVNDVSEIGADLGWSAMGVDVIDLNGDGVLDYCVTDTGPMACLLSSPDGIFVESSAALGLVPEGLDNAWETVGWSVMFNDLDNDGWWDAAYTGGPMGQQQDVKVEDIPDVMWAGRPDGGFADVTAQAGFGDTRDHYGMAQADFDGDGALEIVIVGPGAPPVYYDNACSAGHWLEIALEGPALNREGWGARVEVTAGDRVWTRELLSLVSNAQSAPRVHVGLGEQDRVDRVRVTWPGGAVTERTDLSTDRVVTLSAD